MFIHFPMHIPKLRINPFSQCNFKLEGLHWRFLVFGGPRVGGSEVQRFRGSEVLSSRWFNIRTSKGYREFKLFNWRLALMYDGRAEARTREWEHWNGSIYRKQKGENWDEDMKMNSEFKRTKTEGWRQQMKTEMWSGFSEGVWSLESDRKCVGGFGGTQSLGFWLV